jgi:acyl carrier protein
MSDQKRNIKDDIRKFIADNYLVGSDRTRLGDDDSFLEQGIVDSIGVIELASHIQRTYGIKIRVPEIVPVNFDTVNRLDLYISRKLQEKAR